MQYSISHIAWDREHDEAVYGLMKQYGFTGLDVAPARILNDLEGISITEVDDFKATIRKHGLRLVGMQSLLYRQPDLTIFDDEETSERTKASLKRMIDLGNALCLSAVVFGSPKNRIMGEATQEKWKRARAFFTELAEYAEAKEILFCIEPNPAIYGGDFLTGTDETIAFIRDIAKPALKLNLDTGTLIANNESFVGLIENNLDVIGHVHLSVPYLKPFILTDVHRGVLMTLKESGYVGWVAIEIAAVETAKQLQVIEEMLQEVQGIQ